jgi:hypothetical protein
MSRSEGNRHGKKSGQKKESGGIGIEGESINGVREIK